MIDPLLPTYNRAPLTFVSGEGPYLCDETGETYLDFAAGIGVNALGHSHAHVVEALKAQAETLWHTSNLFHIPGQDRLAQRLVDATFADTVFFTNSGGEAVECGLKMARRYQIAAGHPERWRVLTIEGAFHGRTLATISAGGQPKHLDGFGPRVDGFDQVAFGDHEALNAAIGPETAAILIEPVQGEGGIRVVPDQCLKGLRELCDEHGLLLILDEVQCGNGRTGTFFAHEHACIAPDILCTAKGLGNGMPIGACLATEKAAAAMTPGCHGSTFGGNPLAMAAGNAVLDILLAPGFFERVSAIAGAFREGLEGLAAQFPDLIQEVRGRGLMVGLKIDGSNADFVRMLLDEHMLAVTAGDGVVRMLPPLIIEEGHVREALDKLAAVCQRLSARNTAGPA